MRPSAWALPGSWSRLRPPPSCSTPSVARRQVGSTSACDLAASRSTARERQVVELVVEGASNDEIGARLDISSRTVESHLRRLFERVDVASRTELAARALREGWLEDVG